MATDFDPDWFSDYTFRAAEEVAPEACERIKDAEEEAHRKVAAALRNDGGGRDRWGSTAESARSDPGLPRSRKTAIDETLLALSRVVMAEVPESPDREKAINTVRMARMEAFELLDQQSDSTALTRRDPFADSMDAQSTRAMRITVVLNIIRRVRMWAFEALRLNPTAVSSRTILTVPSEPSEFPKPAAWPSELPKPAGWEGTARRPGYEHGGAGFGPEKPDYWNGATQARNAVSPRGFGGDDADTFAISAFTATGATVPGWSSVFLSDTRGNDDTGDGSQARPFRTLPRALAEAKRRAGGTDFAEAILRAVPRVP